MVGEELLNIVPELEGPIKTLTLILKIIGGIIGVYVIIWFINMVINARNARVLKKILDNVEEINMKLGRGKRSVTN